MSGPHDPLVFPLDAYLPAWRAWYGKRTGRYWAMPVWEGAPDVMVEAANVAELDERMTEIEQR